MPVDETRWPDVPEMTMHEKLAEAVGTLPGRIFFTSRFMRIAFGNITPPPNVFAYHTMAPEPEPDPEPIILHMQKHCDSPSWRKPCTGPRRGPAYRNGKKRY